MKLIKKLKRLGFDGPFVGGRHEYMKQGSHKITIPNTHGNKELGRSILGLIAKELGMTNEEFRLA